MRHLRILTIGLVLTSAPLSAQVRYASGLDTLRFREVTRAETRLTTPRGEVPVRSEHDATIAVVRSAGDTARAWYEALVLGVAGPAGERRPATAAALRTPFMLRFDARGGVSALAVPRFPADFEGVSDLTHQFDDFFLRLPAGALTVGRTWQDTSTRVTRDADKAAEWRAIATYRVERDTVVSGVAAVVVRMEQQLQNRSEGPVAGQPLRAVLAMTGTETGYVVFAPQAGRMLARRREGQLAGDLQMRGAGGEMTFKQQYRYTSAIDALR